MLHCLQAIGRDNMQLMKMALRILAQTVEYNCCQTFKVILFNYIALQYFHQEGLNKLVKSGYMNSNAVRKLVCRLFKVF